MASYKLIHDRWDMRPNIVRKSCNPNAKRVIISQTLKVLSQSIYIQAYIQLHTKANPGPEQLKCRVREKWYILAIFSDGGGAHSGLTGRPIKNANVPKKVRNGAQKGGMMTRNLEHHYFLPFIEKKISSKY